MKRKGFVVRELQASIFFGGFFWLYCVETDMRTAVIVFTGDADTPALHCVSYPRKSEWHVWSLIAYSQGFRDNKNIPYVIIRFNPLSLNTRKQQNGNGMNRFV